MTSILLFYTSLLLHILTSFSSIAVPKIKVVIAGAGPGGLMTAYALLSRSQKYDVEIYESNSDPRLTPSGPRSYSLGLNIRGQYAINYFENKQRMTGLWKAITSCGVASDSFFLHIGKIKFQIRKPVKLPEASLTEANKDDAIGPPPTLLIQRNDLCSAMLNELERSFDQTNRLKIHFENKIQAVDIQSQVAILSNSQQVSFDLLIGSDGVQSAVRRAMMNHTRRGDSDVDAFYSEEVLLPGIFKVMVQPTPANLENDAVHAMETSRSKANFSLFLIPAINNRTCVLVSSKLPTSTHMNEISMKELALPLSEDATIDEIKSEIADIFPAFGTPTDDAVNQLLQQRPSEIRTVRCNRYHFSNPSRGGVLLLGDAAHSTGGSLGQGANSALLDVVALDQCLDRYNDTDLPAALSLFSKQQVPEGLALWQLLQLPPAGVPGAFYQLSQLLWGFLSSFRFLKRMLPQPTQNLLSQSLTPFTAIVRKNQFWINIATKRFYDMKYSPTPGEEPVT